MVLIGCGTWLLSVAVGRAQPVAALDHFSWGALPATVSSTREFAASIEARDLTDNLVSNFNGTASLRELVPVQRASLLITEVEALNFERIELSNVSSNAVDMSGWRVVLYPTSSNSSSKMLVTG